MLERTQILMFHRVKPDPPVAFGLPDSYRLRGTSLTVDEFLCVLENTTPVISLASVEHALAHGCPPPSGAVLTFDDGYREHLDLVAPLLKERGLVATFYVATGIHAAGRLAVVDHWYALLDRAERGFATVPLPDGTVFRGRLDTISSKREWVEGAPKTALLSAPPGHQQRMIEALAEHTEAELPTNLSAQLYLSQDEWKALVRLGMRLGAHTVSHARLTTLHDDEIAREVSESAALVRGICESVTFAYPDGDLDGRVVELMRHHSLSSAVTCEPGDVLQQSDLSRLPRRFVKANIAASNGPSCGRSAVDLKQLRVHRTAKEKR